MAQEHGLSWGALQFAGSVDPDLDYQIHALADGSNFGNPQPLLEIVKSLLSDGSLAVLQGWDNREVPIRLCVAAKGGIAGPALAAAESALMAEVMALSKSPLIWVPPAQDAATCVFDVVAAKLERDNSEGWDFDEVKREERYYLLTLTCLPFARTEEPTIVSASPYTSAQFSRTITVGGSAPTQGLIRLFRSSPGSIGDTLVYSSTNLNFLPPLRTFIDSSSAPTVDASMISGARNTLATPTVFKFSAEPVLPGTYALMARLSSLAGGELTWSARTVKGDGTDTIGSNVTSSGTVALEAETYRIVDLAALTLPTIEVAGDQAIELTLTGDSLIIIDEVWLFSLDNGSLTWVDSSLSAATFRWLEIRPAMLGTPRQSVYGALTFSGTNGETATDAECIDHLCPAFGSHQFDPGPLLFFVANTPQATAIRHSAEFYPRYHSHVEGSAA